MNNINDIIPNFGAELNQALKNLSQSIIDEKSLTVEIVADKQMLLRHHIISTKENEKSKIELSDSLVYGLLKEYQKRKLFTFSNDASEWQKVNNYFEEIKGNKSGLLIQYYQFMLRYFSFYFPEKLSDIVISEKFDLDWMLRALERMIPLLCISPESLYRLAEMAKEHRYKFCRAAREYCKSYYSDGCELIQLLLANENDDIKRFSILCMYGLWDNNYEQTKEFLFEMYENDDWRNLITFSFSNCLNVYPDKCEELYEKVSAHGECMNDATLRFYWEVYRLNNDLREACEVKLLAFIEHVPKNLLRDSIEELLYLNSSSDFVRNYISKMMTNTNFDLNYLSLLDDCICAGVCDSLLLDDIIRTVSGFEWNLKDSILPRSTNSAFEKDPIGFVDMVVKLITDNKGNIRFLGRKIWDNNNLIDSSFNPLVLSRELQLKFIASMLEGFFEPKYRLRKVLLLFDSSASDVPQFLLKRLFLCLDNYMGGVMVELDSLQLKNTQEINQLKDYYEKRHCFIGERVGCKELDPLYTQCKVLNESQRVYSEYVKGMMKNAETQNVFKNLFPTIVLAKGGGFRRADGSAQGLAEISHSMLLPMMSFSWSQLEEREQMFRTFEDWNK